MFNENLINNTWSDLTAGEDRKGIEIETKNNSLLFFQDITSSEIKRYSIQINDASFEKPNFDQYKLFSLDFIEITNGRSEIRCELNDNQFIEEFNSLIVHLTKKISSIESLTEIINEVEKQFKRWATFFDSIIEKGMSKGLQTGLYGELWFLKNKIIPKCGIIEAMNTYRGSEGRQDFQFSGCLIEVKSSTSTRSYSMRIANENQLDPVNNLDLFLAYIHMEAANGSGQTLTNIVNEIKELCNQSSSEILTRFEELLIDAKYNIAKPEQCDEIGFSIRETKYFHVRDDFPRIKSSDLLEGVGGVRYSIDVSACAEYSIEESRVLELINER